MTQYTQEHPDFCLYFHGVGTAGNFNAHNLVTWAKFQASKLDPAIVAFITTECTARGFEARVTERIAPLDEHGFEVIVQDELDRDELMLEFVLLLEARMLASRGVLS